MKYYTSDTHYAHANICRGTTRWGTTDESGVFYPSIGNTRNYSRLEDMNDAIIYEINSVVGEDDELYHLGDWSFGGIENIWNFRKQIKCKNIHLVEGNHDHHISKNKILPNCHYDFKDVELIVDGPNPKRYGDDRDELFDVYAQDLFKSVSKMLIEKVGKTEIVMTHYPFEQWKDMDRGTWHLHGHCHGNLGVDEFRRIDVGLDATGFKVLSFDEISDIMSKRTNKRHH